MDVSNENIELLYKIVQNKENKINPNFFSRTCGTTGLVVFIIKDALEYIGLLEKKTCIQKAYKFYEYYIGSCEQKKKKLQIFLRE